MAIIRACSYEASIKTPQAPSAYSKIVVTFQQKGVNLIQKNKSALTIEDDKVIVKLTQAETKTLECGMKVYMQIRCYASTYDAPGSVVWAIDVFPALDDEVLS